jgi:hypothetical protein
VQFSHAQREPAALVATDGTASLLVAGRLVPLPPTNGQPARCVSLGADGTLMLGNAGGSVFMMSVASGLPSQWQPMPGGDIVAVACADARHQWVLTRDEQVWYFFNGWVNVPGVKLASISAFGRRCAGVTSGGNILVAKEPANASGWLPVPGGLSHVSISDTILIGTNSGGSIFVIDLPTEGASQGGGGAASAALVDENNKLKAQVAQLSEEVRVLRAKIDSAKAVLA